MKSFSSKPDPSSVEKPDDPVRRRLLAATSAGCAAMATAPLLAAARVPGLAGAEPQPPRASGEPASDIYAALRQSTLGALYQTPAVGGLLSYLGALLLPVKGKTPEQMWREYTDGRISETVFKLVKADLEGLTGVARLYRDAVASEDSATLHAQSIAANTQFVALLPRFQLQGEEIALLPLFAIAATLHLALLRDIVLKGHSIGFTDASLDTYRNDLTRLIQDYTGHADRFVAAAMARARDDNPDTGLPATRNQPLSAMLATKATLQLSVIDQRDTWYAFDATRFPGPKRVWLVRELFTPIAGWWDLQSKAPDSIPAWESPGFRIDRLEVFVRQQWRTRWLSAFKLHYGDTDGSLESGEIWGDRYQLALDPSFWITGVRTHFGAGLAMIELRDTLGRTHRFGRPAESNEPHVDHAYPGHGLTSIRSVGRARDSGAAKGAVSGCVYGFCLEQPTAATITPALASRIAPVIAPALRDWIAAPVQ